MTASWGSLGRLRCVDARNHGRRRRVGETTQLPGGVGVGTAARGRQTSWRSKAYAVAAARDETPSLPKMLLTCRSTVRSLSTSFSAMARLVAPVANQPEHLELARTEQLVAAGEPGEVRHRAEVLEDRPRCVHLAIGGLAVAQGAAGIGEQDASACLLVRRTRADPGAERLTKQRERLCRCAARETDRRLRVLADSGHHRAAVHGREVPQLAGGGLGRIGLTDSEQDLGGGGENLDALPGLVGLRERASGHGGRCLHAPAGQPEQREPRLRVLAELRREREVLLGRVEPAEQPVEVSAHAGGPAGGPLVRVREAHRAELVERLGPAAVELLELCPAYLALAGEVAEVRLRRDPLRHRGGPLLRPSELVDRPAALDHTAVDDAFHHGGART